VERAQPADHRPGPRSAPARVAGDASWAAVSVGDDICGIRTDGTLWCWGWAFMSTTPTQVGEDRDWASVTAGDYASCAIRTDRTLWCWGDNYSGEVGDGTTTERDLPVQVSGDAHWTSVDVWQRTCGIRTDGTLWCWGDDQTTPARVGTASTWRAVDIGVQHRCAVDSAGAAWCWGGNEHGQLGDGTKTDRAAPVRVTGGTWKNEPATATATPTPVDTTADWAAVSLGTGHICGVRTDASAWCWGWNSTGQLGDGTTTRSTRPVQILGDRGWLSVAAGTGYTCGIRTDHSLWCWGSNDNMELGATLPVRRRITAPPE
jgi:alpha-tubulin suppressor-like RCC1 family protein